MRNMKKWLATALALVMVFAMAACAVADGETPTYSITINNSAEGHTYEAYQIFTGDLSGTTLSNIVWGSGISEAGQTALDDAAAKAEKLKTEDDAKAFAKEVAPYLATVAGSASTVTDGKYVISGLTAGYYLVKDQDDSLTGDNDSYTEYIVKVVSNTTATPKSDVPTVQKKVQDINDSTDDAMTNWQDSADHDIGDSVPFQLKATLANNVSSYTTYKVVFHDTQSKGLTYNNDAKVYIDGKEAPVNTEATDDFTVTAVKNADGTTTLTVSCDDVKALGAKNSSVITVEYTATLNENAVLGSAGNPNKVYLEYSNNPNKSEEGNNETGETPKDVVIVFTYKVTANKVTSDKTPLAGAAFELFKKDAKTGEYVSLGVVGATKNGDGTYTVDADTKTFSWTGIDDGDYKIVEVVTPAGYNTIAPIEFTVSATHDTESSDPKLTGLTAGNAFTGEVSTGTLSTEIVNLAGTELPSTGGMGTTVLYVGGGVLVLAAVVLLIAKRRSNA
ncbi:MAG: isopeptide-forming domain-containing fimbrial protein [Candidatus Ventricola sp.]